MDVHKNKDISQTNLDNRTWKIVLQNTRGLITENSNKKLKLIEEYTNEEKILAMNFTETWLEKTKAETICEIRHKGCEMVAINIPELETINIVVYRPPKTKKSVFDKILNEIENFLRNTTKPELTMVLSGDFN